MRNLKIALFSLVVATSACKKDEGDKAAEPAKPAGDTAKPADDVAKPDDKPAEPAAGGGSGDACADLKTKLCEGLDAAKCGTWFDTAIAKDELNEGQTIPASEQAFACKMILGDAQSLDGWKGEAKANAK
jgi:hypothetical protein